MDSMNKCDTRSKIGWISPSVAAAAFSCLLAIPAAAQYVDQHQLNSFDAFLNHNPQVATELRRNPNLVDNSAYLERRPQLHSFLEDHDALRRAIQTHPGKFMYQGGRYSYGWGQGGWNPAWNRQPSRQEWARMHGYGYTDPYDHRWHDREWWEHNRADWVRGQHPSWQAANAEQRGNYDAWLAQRQRQERQTANWEQHHANLQHEQALRDANRHQHQANRRHNQHERQAMHHERQRQHAESQQNRHSAADSKAQHQHHKHQLQQEANAKQQHRQAQEHHNGHGGDNQH
jgi:hypothetical protein